MFGVFPRWSVRLFHGPVVLRPLATRDEGAWFEIRERNAAWLGPWDATSPTGERWPSFREMVRALADDARQGRSLPFAIEYQGALAGQLTVSGIQYGAARSATAGYWIDEELAGRGIVPLALALATDHCFFDLGLHRMEINIRPGNAASLRVVEKLGFRREGMRKGLLHINGEWADHLSFALLAEEVPEGLVRRARVGTRVEDGAEGQGLPDRH